MSKLYYPAVFHVSEDIGGYWSEFPDLSGCFSQGKTIYEIMENSKEALGLFLDQSDDIYERRLPSPSDITKIMENFPGEVVVLIEYNSVIYARKYKNKSVKKTLTIPQWLDEETTSHGINFSRVLQEALISKLHSM